jgi:hypothetical protein
MGLRNFECRGVPRTYGDVVKNVAVLFELTGPLKRKEAYKPAIIAKTKKLIRQWRARVNALVKVGWYLAGDDEDTRRRWFMLNCRPAFFISDGKDHTCNVASLCPHCWARNVYHTWYEIDRKLFGERPDKRTQKTTVSEKRNFLFEEDLEPTKKTRSRYYLQYEMIEREVVYTIKFGKSYWVDVLRTFLNQRLFRARFRSDGERDTKKRAAGSLQLRVDEHRSFRRYGVAGGLDTMAIDFDYGQKATKTPVAATEPNKASHASAAIHVDAPAADKKHQDRKPTALKITVRQLLIVEFGKGESIIDNQRFSDVALVMKLQGFAADPVLKHTPVVTRRALAYAVARTLRYPRGLMRARADAVRDLLEARKGYRLTTKFGALRGDAPESLLPPIEIKEDSSSAAQEEEIIRARERAARSEKKPRVAELEY